MERKVLLSMSWLSALRARAAMVLIAMLCVAGGAWADELTVYGDGEATNSNVPVEGYWADAYQKCEFVIPQAEVTPMASNSILSMTFYLYSPAATAWGGNFVVFMKEVSETTISDFYGMDDATVVFEGPLDGTQSTMTLDFDVPYSYNGGNLLIGVYQTLPGSYKSASFVGAEVEGASIQGHNSSFDAVSASQKNFIPKTTFTYGTPPAVAKPTNVTVNYTGGLTAEVTWTSDESLFDIDVNGTVTENITANPYTLTGLDYGTLYTVKVCAKKDEDISDWSSAATFRTDYAAFSLPYAYGFEEGMGPWTMVNCANSSGASTNGSGHEGSNNFHFAYNYYPPQYLISPEFETAAMPMEVSFWYLIGNKSYPETFQVGYSTTTKDVDAFTWETEVEATNDGEWLQYQTTFPAGTKFVAFRYNSYDMYYLYVDDFSFTLSDGFVKPADLAVSEIFSRSAVLSWTEKGEATAWVIELTDNDEEKTSYINASENPFTITGLTPETEYFARVRQAGDTEKWSDGVYFTTGVANAAPKELTANNILATTAEISWTADDNATGTELQYGEPVYNETHATLAYDNGEQTNAVGNSSEATWTWGVMYPASMITGNTLYSVSMYELAANNTGEITITIYQGGDSAPETPIYTETVSPAGEDGYHQVIFASPVDITPGKNLWITLTETGTYVLLGSSSSASEPNATWVENSGSWAHVTDFGISCGWMIRAEINSINPDAMAWTTVDNATSPCQLVGLTPETNYMVRVKSLYAENVESAWTFTTFTTSGLDVVPVNLQTADITFTSATLSWEGEQESYNMRYRSAGSPDPSAPATIILEAHDVWGDGSGYQLLLDADANTYGTLWNASHQIFVGGEQYSEGDLPEEYFNEFEYKLPEEADGSLSTTNVVVDGTVTITIPAGTYDYAIFNPTPGARFYVAADNGNVGGAEDDFVFEPGMTYHFIMGQMGSGDGATLEITSSWSDWTVVNDIADTSYELTGLTPGTEYQWQVQGIYKGEPTEWSEVAAFTTEELLELADDVDNSTIIAANNGKETNVKLVGRTLSADSWNTFAVPFNLDTPSGWTVKELTSTSYESSEEKLTLNFEDATSIEAGKPYLVKVAAEVSEPIFSGVTVSTNVVPVEDSFVDFIPIFGKTTVTGDDANSVLFLAADNKLKNPTDLPTDMKGFRAYFQVKFNNSARNYVLNFGDDVATGISEVRGNMEDVSGVYYDLQGRRVAQPAKGLYIVNGKKVIK